MYKFVINDKTFKTQRIYQRLFKCVHVEDIR